ncbi:hypothetical protein [Streptomyces parvus]|uniref:hypothetical protein n=1 Tax=Streptomyces parvus TaxID=66428 RepID=UPI00210198DD|nr:hypothetical protein [Streptomyces parvus]MCQ1580586.1 hypothetical protein [Streptomyces parvus]
MSLPGRFRDLLLPGQLDHVSSDVRFVARETGRTLETAVVQLIRVRGGRIEEFRPFYRDPAAVRGALGTA